MHIMFILIAENKTLETKTVVARHLSVDVCVIYKRFGRQRDGRPRTRAARSFNVGFTNKEN
jgi:hypothetical protein